MNQVAGATEADLAELADNSTVVETPAEESNETSSEQVSEETSNDNSADTAGSED
jgi:hypothetical protein